MLGALAVALIAGYAIYTAGATLAPRLPRIRVTLLGFAVVSASATVALLALTLAVRYSGMAGPFVVGAMYVVCGIEALALFGLAASLHHNDVHISLEEYVNRLEQGTPVAAVDSPTKDDPSLPQLGGAAVACNEKLALAVSITPPPNSAAKDLIISRPRITFDTRNFADIEVHVN